MLKLIAIGGGKIGRLGQPIETTEIDKEIIRISGKKNPRLLFIPTASIVLLLPKTQPILTAHIGRMTSIMWSRLKKKKNYNH